MKSKIVAFYEGFGADHRGRSFEEILGFDDDALEYIHDYIQWLFPLMEPSAFNPWAPVLTQEDVRAFQASETLRQKLGRAFERIWLFYGFDENRRDWVTPGNHNFLRLTRILTSTKLLGRPDCTGKLFAALEELYGTHSSVIGPVTYRYWKNAR